MNKLNHRTVIVGAGMSGLTAAAYLTKDGYDVLLLEKNTDCGGLLNSFERDGFVFDSGPRSILNSGIIRPMLKQLGIEHELLKSPVSIGIEDVIIDITSKESINDYKCLLEKLYPDSIEDIDKIITLIKRILKDMAVLYGIDNPFFRDLKHDKAYIFKELLPWVGKFLFTLIRISKMKEPVEEILEKLSSNRSLIDIIDQHFFKNTPTFFALGYFYVYLDYIYPKGGTGELPKILKQKIIEWGGKIQTKTEITGVNPAEKRVIDKNGNSYPYDDLIWCSDLKTLYKILKIENLNEDTTKNILEKKELLLSKHGGDSIFTLYLGVDEPLESFESISKGHFFYTPSKKGMGELQRSIVKSLIDNFHTTSKEKVLQWLDGFCQLNTYEISIPALRDPSLTPNGKTGMEISFLFEYELMKKIQEAGWYVEFKKEIENRVIDIMSNSIYPKIKDKILIQFSSTPIDIQNIVGSSEGAITGWTYETPVPVVNDLRKIAQSVKTPIPYILQAGQWAYSPAGVPTAILTGWNAAQSILKNKK